MKRTVKIALAASVVLAAAAMAPGSAGTAERDDLLHHQRRFRQWRQPRRARRRRRDLPEAGARPPARAPRPGAPISAPPARSPSTRATASAADPGRTPRAKSSPAPSTTCTATRTISTSRPRSPRPAQVVNGRGDKPNMHDILTGSIVGRPRGRRRREGHDLQQLDEQPTPARRSSGITTARASTHRRRCMSWNSSHGSKGCSQQALVSTGGNGLLYCFAAN